jgi:hypothetical protein
MASFAIFVRASRIGPPEDVSKIGLVRGEPPGGSPFHL